MVLPEGVSSWGATQQADGARAASRSHMLRHTCGYALAMRGTTREQFKTGSGIARSTEPSPARFKEFLARLAGGPTWIGGNYFPNP